MVIYTQRTRQQLVGQKVASALPMHLPTTVAATCPPALESQGMTLPIERPVAGCGMSMGNAWAGAYAVVADIPAAERLTSLPTTTNQRDAFAGILPGPNSFVSPPV